MKWLIVLSLIVLSGCFRQPTQEELEETQRAKAEYCGNLRDEIEDADRPLVRAARQQRYNDECLGQN